VCGQLPKDWFWGHEPQVSSTGTLAERLGVQSPMIEQADIE